MLVLKTLVPTQAVGRWEWQRLRPQEITSGEELLAAVRGEVEARMRQSLRPEAEPPVPRLWEVEVKVGKQRSQKLSEGQTILDFFSGGAFAGILLILGAPGAGKTTTLLELAAAWANGSDSSVPVLLDLGSWRSRQPVRKWLLAQVSAKYGVSVAVVRQLLEEGKLVLLLDGLDELAPALQEECLEQLNHLHEVLPSLRLVVCARHDWYQQCHHRLRLYGAVGLQPVQTHQIEAYLLATRSRQLWYQIADVPVLLALAKNPLFLNLMVWADEEILINSWKRLATKEERREYVVNAFIRAQLNRSQGQPWYRGSNKPTPEQARGWLGWLAERMHDRAIAEFSVENILFPGERSPLQSVYSLAIVLALVFAYTLCFGLINHHQWGWVYALIYGIIGGGLGAIVSGKARQQPIPTTSTQFLWFAALKGIIIAAIGLLSWQLLTLVPGLDSNPDYPAAVVMFTALLAPLFGLVGGILAAHPAIESLAHRLTLWRLGHIPWNCRRFLNYAAACGLLQRVGDRYRFSHPLVQNQFATIYSRSSLGDKATNGG